MYVTVFCTTKDKAEAQSIAEKLVTFKLAACVNILEGVNSIYTFEGKLCKETEALMIIKTKNILFEDLEKAIKMHHSYDNPEIIALPIEKGSKSYLSWMGESTA